jgi:hypothetical protein
MLATHLSESLAGILNALSQVLFHLHLALLHILGHVFPEGADELLVTVLVTHNHTLHLDALCDDLQSDSTVKGEFRILHD